MRIWLGPAAGIIGTVSTNAAFAEAAKGTIINNPTTAWNHAWTEVLIDLFVIGGIFAAVAVYLLVRYRTRDPEAVGTAVPLNLEKALAWALVPAAIFMADDFLLSAKGWSLWNIQRTVPQNAMEVKVTAYQWYFEFDYGNGVTATDLVVPVGQPVVMRMTSNDVIHSFGLNEYRLKEDIVPGRITRLWFLPDKPRETDLICVEFCGNSHSEMTSKVKAVAKADFDAWMAKNLKKAEDRRRLQFAVSAETAPAQQ
ncbi:cytochrome c oxidase subunit II [Bradyrhizobium sp.]|uniref:cytochrome c oxidase subunit II n=1 Tax=Bradyrhizobium sp. TaxID=376 RepID=UPI0040384B2E